MDILSDVATQAPNAQQRRKRPRFWLGPLLTGAFFAFGYGITYRIITLRSSLQQTSTQTFSAAPFPGERLEQLRVNYDSNSTPLQADVAARETLQAAKRKAKLQLENLAVEAARRREQELQAAVKASEPVVAEPALPPPDPSLPSAPPQSNTVEAAPKKPQPSVIPAANLLRRRDNPQATSEIPPIPLDPSQTFTKPPESSRQP